MNNYNRAATIKQYSDKIINREMEFSDLRKTLKAQNLDDEEINIVVKLTDKKVLRAEIIEMEYQKGKNIYYGGLILTIVALIITIGTFTGLIDLKGIGILAYGPIAGGLLMVMKGKSLMNRK